MLTEDSVPDNVVDLSSRRKRDFVVTVNEVAETGSSPFHCLASDGKKYWCKLVSGPNRAPEVVNEVVGSQIGRRLGAPMRPWKILDVPPELVNEWAGTNTMYRYRLPEEPVFASEEVPGAVHSYYVTALSRDGNFKRFPLLIATWLLCNAEDIQLLYDVNADMSVWSVDHGFWFGSHETPWVLEGPEYLAGRTELPPLRGEIPSEHWVSAIEAVDKFDASVLDDVLSRVPDEWAVAPEKYADLVHYAVGRKNYTVERLRELQLRSRKR